MENQRISGALYDVYALTRAVDAPDLTIGLAHYRERHPELTHEEEKELRGFMGRHGQELAKAFPHWTQFAAAVEAAQARDAAQEGGEG